MFLQIKDELVLEDYGNYFMVYKILKSDSLIIHTIYLGIYNSSFLPTKEEVYKNIKNSNITFDEAFKKDLIVRFDTSHRTRFC